MQEIITKEKEVSKKEEEKVDNAEQNGKLSDKKDTDLEGESSNTEKDNNKHDISPNNNDETVKKKSTNIMKIDAKEADNVSRKEEEKVENAERNGKPCDKEEADLEEESSNK